MRGLLTVAVAVLVGLVATTPLLAGLYIPERPALVTANVDPNALFDFRIQLLQLPPNPTGSESKLRPEYLKRVAELEAKEDNLTALERVNLSGYYLRLMPGPDLPQASKAIRVLEAIPAAQRDFMALANLAMAYQMADPNQFAFLQRAQSTLEQAIQVWPQSSPYFNPVELNWLLRAEKLHARLLQVRSLARLKADREPPASSRRRDAKPIALDALFPGVPYRGPQGEYAFGPLPPKDALQLPWDAYLLTWQLVLWMPWDDLLYWQLAEVANASAGDFEAAATILGQLMRQRQFNQGVLSRQLTLLGSASRIRFALVKELRIDKWNRLGQEELAAVAVPLQSVLPPGVGLVLDAQAMTAAVEKVVREPSTWNPPGAQAPASASAAATTDDWRHLVVSFVLGAAIALLGVLQVRQIQRRRKLADAGFAPERRA